MQACHRQSRRGFAFVDVTFRWESLSHSYKEDNRQLTSMQKHDALGKKAARTIGHHRGKTKSTYLRVAKNGRSRMFRCRRGKGKVTFTRGRSGPLGPVVPKAEGDLLVGRGPLSIARVAGRIENPR